MARSICSRIVGAEGEKILVRQLHRGKLPGQIPLLLRAIETGQRGDRRDERFKLYDRAANDCIG